jgi:hypothetical protein
LQQGPAGCSISPAYRVKQKGETMLRPLAERKSAPPAARCWAGPVIGGFLFFVRFSSGFAFFFFGFLSQDFGSAGFLLAFGFFFYFRFSFLKMLNIFI